MKIQQILDTLVPGGNVTRYHGEIGPIPQTTGHHAWGVASIVELTAPDLIGPAFSKSNVVRAALFHDYPERKTGDVSYVAKADNPDLKYHLELAENADLENLGIGHYLDLTEAEAAWLKYSDMMELCLWCRHLWTRYLSAEHYHIYGRGHGVIGNLPLLNHAHLHPYIGRSVELYSALPSPMELATQTPQGAIYGQAKAD